MIAGIVIGLVIFGLICSVVLYAACVCGGRADELLGYDDLGS
jgi:hypothetical protein